MNQITRRRVLPILLAAPAAAAERLLVLRKEIAGEWCFVRVQEHARREAVLILHGAGEWVNEKTSSWEMQPGATLLLDALANAGYVVAQSNSAARNGNGMWGNADTQSTTAQFLEWLRNEYRIEVIHAVAVSAGNLTLLNLILNRRASFASAVMLAPCISIASEYKCPGNVNRVKTIAEAYRFLPRSACPGDPEHDPGFMAATVDSDPLPRMAKQSDADLASSFSAIRLLAIYETRDPRVPPGENILPFAARLRKANIPIAVTEMEAETHGSQELFTRHIAQILAFL